MKVKTKLFFTKRKYYRKIVSFLILFIFIMFLPFTFLSYKVAEKNILNSINSSNFSILSQINQNYTTFSNSIKELCLNLFLNNDIQNILYSKNISYNQTYLTLSDVTDTTMSITPFLHSISLYNKYKNEYFTLCKSGQISDSEISEFVTSQNYIPLLSPLLHEIKVIYPNCESNQQILSFFMYEYGNPARNNSSHLLINVKAEWFISNMKLDMPSDQYPTETVYFLSNSQKISNRSLISQEEEEIHDKLIAKSILYQKDTISPNRGFYIDSINDKDKYLITYLNIGNDNALFMVQEYNKVFADLIKLRNDFYTISMLAIPLGLLLIYIISRKIYDPVNNALRFFIRENPASSNLANDINEFEYLKDVYCNTNEQYKENSSNLAKYKPMVLQYNLQMLLLQDNPQIIAQFKRLLPAHWLSQTKSEHLRVILLQIDSLSKNQFDFQDNDLNLLTYSAQNIAEEILSTKNSYSCFKVNLNTIGIVLGTLNNYNIENLINDLIIIQTHVKTYFDITLSISLSNEKVDIKNLHHLYNEALRNLSYKYIYGPNSLITTDKCKLNEHNMQTSYKSELDTSLDAALNQKDIEKIIVTLDEIKSILSTFNINNINLCTLSLLNQINQSINKFTNTMSVGCNLAFNDTYLKILNADTLDSFFMELMDYIQTKIGNSQFIVEDSDKIFISTIVSFIQSNYSDANLSSQLIAEHIGLSCSYVMRKFKKLTQVTLNDYIMNIRLKKAVVLIQNTNQSISSIAEQVGIVNVNYFYKLFHNKYGCTPREHKEKLSQI